MIRLFVFLVILTENTFLNLFTQKKNQIWSNLIKTSILIKFDWIWSNLIKFGCLEKVWCFFESLTKSGCCRPVNPFVTGFCVGNSLTKGICRLVLPRKDNSFVKSAVHYVILLLHKITSVPIFKEKYIE